MAVWTLRRTANPESHPALFDVARLLMIEEKAVNVGTGIEETVQTGTVIGVAERMMEDETEIAIVVDAPGVAVKTEVIDGIVTEATEIVLDVIGTGTRMSLRPDRRKGSENVDHENRTCDFGLEYSTKYSV